MNIDITELRRAKTALEARERELSLIIETIPAFAWSAPMLAVLLLLASPCFAQSVPTQAPPTASARQRPAFNLDRSEEDWQFLRDPSRREDFWDPLKYIPLGREGWYLTLAREIRPFYEIHHNHNWAAAQGGAITCSDSWEARTCILETGPVSSWNCKAASIRTERRPAAVPGQRHVRCQPGLCRIDRYPRRPQTKA
jgi:hypothetical protein